MRKKAILLSVCFILLFVGLGYPHEPDFQKYNTSNFSVFDNCFELYVSPGVVQYWGDSNITVFINSVLDDDTANGSDVFPIIWNYFCPNDLDSSQTGIRFTVNGTTFTKIKYYLYDPNDADCDSGAPDYFCRGYGWYAGNNVFYSAIRIMHGSELLYPRDPLVMGLFAHELQHLCNSTSSFPDIWLNETKSELARLLSGYKKVNVGVFDYNIPFDNPLPCFLPGPTYTSKYWHWYLWAVYLYEQFAGQMDTSGDDFWYQHIRRDPTTFTGMYSIARMFEKQQFRRYGLSGDDLLKEVFLNWAVANLLDDPTLDNGEYGYTNIDLTDEIGFLRINSGDPDTLQNRGYAPALHLIDTSFVDSPHIYSIIYGKDSISVYLYSADYIRLLSDSSLDEGAGYRLVFQLQEDGISSQPNIELVGKALVLDSQRRVVSVEKLEGTPSGIGINITSFGKHVRELNLIICAVEKETNEGRYWVEDTRQLYSYSVNLEEYTGVQDEDYDSPEEDMGLCQNYPNPFNASTVIPFFLNKSGQVKVTIYNVLGQRVFSLSKVMPQGYNQIEWNGRDDAGQELPSGTYFYSLTTGQRSQTRKLTLLR